jgi:hypothetical protein
MSAPCRLSGSYAQSRHTFLAAAEAAGARVEHHPHPGRGLEGEDLAVDVAELGPSDAAHVVLVVSATHGVEGFCGSALQTGWLAQPASPRPDDLRLVFVHALNPHGFSWVRRVNEDNVDLNRNFVDWSQPPPENPEYDEIAHLLVPPGWSDDEQSRTTVELVAVAERLGLERMQDVVSRGQYRQPTGVFYGGSGPVWSNRWLRSWCGANLGSCRRLTIIDLHSGLGPWGHGELICVESAGTAPHERARALWGDVTSMADGSAAGSILQGDWLSCAHLLAPHAETTSGALEFGTVDPVTVAQALRADAWLHAYGDPTGPVAAQVRAQVRAAFADDDPAWIDTLWDRFTGVLGAALAG